MLDIRRDRSSDGFLAAQYAARTGVRCGALVSIAVCLVFWTWSRPWAVQATLPSDRILEVVSRAGLQPIGYFREPATGLLGVEISRGDCLKPVALLPARIGAIELAPDKLNYRDGDYQVAYVFDGDLYPQKWISLRLEFLSTWRRLTSLATRANPKRFYAYMKIWTPSGCQGLSSQEVMRLPGPD